MGLQLGFRAIGAPSRSIRRGEMGSCRLDGALPPPLAEATSGIPRSLTTRYSAGQLHCCGHLRGGGEPHYDGTLLALAICIVALVLSFVLCVGSGLAVPPGVHGTRFLEMTLPGFVWLTPGTFVLGLVETVIIGAYVGFVFTSFHNAVAGRWR